MTWHLRVFEFRVCRKHHVKTCVDISRRYVGYFRLTVNGHNFLLADGEGKSIRAYRKNQNIFVQDEVATAVFYLQRGRVKVSAKSKQGKDAVVGILTPGQFFGESCLTDHPNRATTAIAMDDCVLTSIDKATMRTALRSEPT
jgi:CRP/FNR family cyclic AMP-dependent transcriptional regulator